MKRNNAITLLSSISTDAHKTLKASRNHRINKRLESSKRMGLGFRVRDDLIKKHGNIKEKYGYTSTAKCFVCDQIVSMCTCKIEIAEINKSPNNDI